MASGSVSLHRPLHTSRPHVVIVGGGFGGLYTARGLARTPVDVTVVDQHNYHLFRPMLYQVATGLLSADEIAAPIRSVLRKQKNTEVLMARGDWGGYAASPRPDAGERPPLRLPDSGDRFPLQLFRP